MLCYKMSVDELIAVADLTGRGIWPCPVPPMRVCSVLQVIYLVQVLAPPPVSPPPMRAVVLQVIELDEVLDPPPVMPPPMRVYYTDLDISDASLNPSPVISRPTHDPEPATDYAIIDFEATSAAARAGRDHVRRREELDCRSSVTRTASVGVIPAQQPY